MLFKERSDLTVSFEELDILECFQAPPQRVFLFSHRSLGKILVIDGEIQHVEAWQAMYHEPLVHLAASFVQSIEKVLILGGGSLFAAFEVLKYSSVKQCVLVDHDARVLEIMNKHYDHAQITLSDKRFIHINKDALQYISEANDTFDLVINDCFDLTSKSKQLKKSLFDKMQSLLSLDGVCADLIYRHAFYKKNHQATMEIIRHIKNIVFSLVAVPEYPGIMHFLMIWGNKNCHQNSTKIHNKIQLDWYDNANAELQYYNPKFREFYLYIPPYARFSM